MRNIFRSLLPRSAARATSSGHASLSRPAALHQLAAVIFLVCAVVFFVPVSLPYKVAYPAFVLFVGSWGLPRPLAFAFLFSALGDVGGAAGNFLLQMGFFGVAQACFAGYFARRLSRLSLWRKGRMGLAALPAVLMLGWMLPTILPCVSPDFLRPGVTVYALLILLMMWLALQQDSPWWALGALLFVASDTCLAWNKFVGPVMNSRLWIMTTYYGALLLLYADSAFHRHEISPRPHAL